MENTVNAIHTMQKYLPILRKINGWTAEDVGRRIGVTKQTISNLENYKVTMTQTQYIALRSVFEYEMRVADENDVLKKVMYILFYAPMQNSEEKEQQRYEALENLSAAASGGITGQQLTMLAMMLLSSVAPLHGVNVNFALQTAEPYAWIEEMIQQEEE